VLFVVVWVSSHNHKKYQFESDKEPTRSHQENQREGDQKNLSRKEEERFVRMRHKQQMSQVLKVNQISFLRKFLLIVFFTRIIKSNQINFCSLQINKPQDRIYNSNKQTRHKEEEERKARGMMAEDKGMDRTRQIVLTSLYLLSLFLLLSLSLNTSI
jgi:hypothetical protein